MRLLFPEGVQVGISLPGGYCVGVFPGAAAVTAFRRPRGSDKISGSSGADQATRFDPELSVSKPFTHPKCFGSCMIRSQQRPTPGGPFSSRQKIGFLGIQRQSAPSFVPRNHADNSRGWWLMLPARVVALVLLMLGATSVTKAENYVPAMALVPDTAAGVLRVPSVPELVKAWKETTLYSLGNDPAMKPFIDFQKQRSELQTKTLGFDIGLRPQDILDVASGEAVAVWLPFEDPRRPFALAVIVDIRGNLARSQELLEQADRDLRAAGATLQESSFGDQKVRRYALKPLPGQIKIDEVAIALDDQRLIAADRESVIVSMLEVIAGKREVSKLEAAGDFVGVREQTLNHSLPAGVDGVAGTIGLEWFARPIAMGRIIKEAAKIDRGKQVDILNLLQRQGFDAVAAMGGQLTVGHGDFDLLHKGFIWAPPVPGQPERFRLAARMLRPINDDDNEVPAWAGPEIASFARVNWELSEAFWHAESLVDDALGGPIFRDLLDGIRDDEEGPQIDIEKNVIPNLGQHVIVITDNQLPADLRSERMLVAIEARDASALREAVRKTLEVDPDATLLPVATPGVQVYRVLRTEEADDFEAEIFGDLEGADDESDVPAPLLNQWAITVLDDPKAAPGASKTPGYLIFSSHPELLLDAVQRFATPNPPASFGQLPGVKSVQSHLDMLASSHGGTGHAFSRLARTDRTMRVKYSLMREGKFRDSDSVLATLFRRIFISSDNKTADLGTKSLPPFEQVESYFRPAGSISKATEMGWTLDGFLLK